MVSVNLEDVESLNVVHHVPGRLRVRIPAGAPTDGLVEAVTAVTGVVSASWAPRTRGLLVIYERGTGDVTAIVDTIATHAGVDAPTVATSTNGAAPTLAAAVTSLAGGVNARVTRASGGLVTLGMLVPLALTVWAAGEVLRGRTGPLAWSTALWYAHGLFRDYHLPSRED